MNGQIFFFLRQLEEGALQTCVNVPVQPTQIISLRIFAIVSELNRRAALAAAPITLHRADAHGIGLERQLLQLLK